MRSTSEEPNNRPELLVYVVGDRIGDGLLKLPAVAALREAFPGHRITWLAGIRGSVFAGPLEPLIHGSLDEVIDEAGVGVSAGELVGPPPLAGRRFDIVIDTQRSLRIALTLRRIPHRLFFSPAVRFLLSSRRPASGSADNASLGDQLFALVELAAGRELAVPPAELRIPPQFHHQAAVLLPEQNRELIGLAPGAGGRNKCWPLQRFVAVAKRQVARGRRPVFLLGPDEEAWRAELASAVPQAAFPEQEVEPVVRGPLLALALAGRLAAAVANDAGAGHILAAAGCPLLSLYGPSDPLKFSRAGPRWRILRAQEFGSRDMSAIPLERVDAALEQLLVDCRMSP
jgi:ADP-heptose:LPS heptosyltransferase